MIVKLQFWKILSLMEKLILVNYGTLYLTLLGSPTGQRLLLTTVWQLLAVCSKLPNMKDSRPLPPVSISCSIPTIIWMMCLGLNA